MQIIIDQATTTDLFNGIYGIFSSLLPIIALFIGIQLAFYISRRVISLLPKSYARR